MEGVPEHLAADEGEKPESNPVIDGGDGAGEQRACGPTDKRHERLKAPEEQGDHQRIAPTYLPHAEAFADGHGERVHGKPDARQEQLDEPHSEPFLPQGVNVSFSSRKKPSARRSATMESKSGGSTSGRPAASSAVFRSASTAARETPSGAASTRRMIQARF